MHGWEGLTEDILTLRVGKSRNTDLDDVSCWASLMFHVEHFSFSANHIKDFHTIYMQSPP
jgi:hypothetical protein